MLHPTLRFALDTHPANDSPLLRLILTWGKVSLLVFLSTNLQLEWFTLIYLVDVIIQNLDNISVQDMIQLFCQASIIIGYHGAGLLNSIFAPNGSILIEIPRNLISSHGNMLPNLCYQTFKLYHKLDSINDYNIILDNFNNSHNNSARDVTHVVNISCQL
jgi:Glycosyltransferase 61